MFLQLIPPRLRTNRVKPQSIVLALNTSAATLRYPLNPVAVTAPLRGRTWWAWPKSVAKLWWLLQVGAFLEHGGNKNTPATSVRPPDQLRWRNGSCKCKFLYFYALLYAYCKYTMHDLTTQLLIQQPEAYLQLLSRHSYRTVLDWPTVSLYLIATELSFHHPITALKHVYTYTAITVPI